MAACIAAIILHEHDMANGLVTDVQQFHVAAANIWQDWVGPDTGPNMCMWARQQFWWLMDFLHIWPRAADVADPQAARPEAREPDLGPEVQIPELEDDIPLKDLEHP
jgi:hypothetical protein